MPQNRLDIVPVDGMIRVSNNIFDALILRQQSPPHRLKRLNLTDTHLQVSHFLSFSTCLDFACLLFGEH
jgi:hypothetical protein